MHSTPNHVLVGLTGRLLTLSRAYRRYSDQALSGMGLSYAQALPVVLLGRLGDGVRQIALADALGIEGPSLVRLLDRLVASALVERRDDPNDRRAKTLHLTAAGRDLAKRSEAALTEVRRQIFSGLSRSDLEATLRVFEHLGQTLAPSSTTVASILA